MYEVFAAVGALIWHSTVVPDVQDAVPHISTPVADAEGVGLEAPKFRPEIVTVVPPVFAAFAGACALATGAASKCQLNREAFHDLVCTPA